jgi:hypothetical protein
MSQDGQSPKRAKLSDNKDKTNDHDSEDGKNPKIMQAMTSQASHQTAKPQTMKKRMMY